MDSPKKLNYDPTSSTATNSTATSSTAASSKPHTRRMSKRRLDQEDINVDSPKELNYDPTSSHLEKRDSSYCKVIEKAKKQCVPTLKSFRVKLDEEDEFDFCGFSQDEVNEHNDTVRKNVFILKEKQEFIDQAFKSAFYDKSLPSTSTGVTSSGELDPLSLYSFPLPIPHEEINDDYPSDQDGDVPVDSVEYPQSLV